MFVVRKILTPRSCQVQPACRLMQYKDGNEQETPSLVLGPGVGYASNGRSHTIPLTGDSLSSPSVVT